MFQDVALTVSGGHDETNGWWGCDSHLYLQVWDYFGDLIYSINGESKRRSVHSSMALEGGEACWKHLGWLRFGHGG